MINNLSYMSRLQKVETRNLQLAGIGGRLMISNGYNRYNVRSPVPARKIYFLQATRLSRMTKMLATSG